METFLLILLVGGALAYGLRQNGNRLKNWREAAVSCGLQVEETGAEAGQLSLAQTEAGQLSLTEDPAGQLSLGDDE